MTVDLEFASAVRQRREELGYGQKEFVDLLAQVGVPISQGHWCNLEMGKNTFQPHHLLATSAILDVGGDRLLRRPAVAEDLGRLPGVAAWKQFLEEIQRPVSSERDDAEGGGLSDRVAVRGTADAVDLVRRELRRAADARPSGSRAPAFFLVGFVRSGGEVSGLGEFWRRARPSLVDAMRAGWRCQHVLCAPSSVSRADVIRFVASLLACEQYVPLLAEEDGREPEGNYLIIPPMPGYDGVAIQFLEPSSDDLMALVRRDAASVEALVRYARGRANGTSPLGGRSFRNEPGTAVGFVDSELDFYRELTARADRGHWYCASHGWFPNWVIPSDIYRQMIEQRAQQASQMYLPEWDELIRLQRERRGVMMERIAGSRPLPIKLVISGSRHQAFLRSGTHYAGEGTRRTRDIPAWRKLPRDHITSIVTAITDMLRDPCIPIEMRVADDQLSSRIDSLGLEVRGGAKDSFAVIATPQHDGAPRSAGTAEFLIEEQLAVVGFKAYFDTVWARAHDLGDDIYGFLTEGDEPS